MLDLHKYAVHLAILLGVMGIISSFVAAKTFDKFDSIKKSDKSAYVTVQTLGWLSVIITALVIGMWVYGNNKTSVSDSLKQSMERLKNTLKMKPTDM